MATPKKQEKHQQKNQKPAVQGNQSASQDKSKLPQQPNMGKKPQGK